MPNPLPTLNVFLLPSYKIKTVGYACMYAIAHGADCLACRWDARLKLYEVL